MKKVRVGASYIRGKGAFALEAIKKGEIVLHMSGEKLSGAEIDALIKKRAIRNDDPFEVGPDTYIRLAPVPLSINHSCDPNVGIRKVNELFALKAIKPGDELTYDYATVVGENAEGETDWCMKCLCGAKNCRRTIGNWRTLPPKRLSFYKKRGALPRLVAAQVLRARARGSSKKSRARRQ